MATLDDFRTITQKFDEISDYAPDIIANSADMQGRILRVEFTSAGEPVTSSTATAKLLWNPSGTNEQLWVNSADMQRVNDAPTLMFTAPLPTGVTQAKTDCVPMCVELADNGQTVATRNFHVRVDKAVGDTIGTGNVNIGQAAADAKAAAASAAASAKSAEVSATRANKSATAAEALKSAAAASAKEASNSDLSAEESASRAGDSASAAAGSAEAAGRSAADARAAVDGFGLTVGGVTTVEPGGEATASVTKDGTWYKLALGIPKGDKGENTAAIRSVAATVDSSTGMPSVDVVSGGTPDNRELTFNFHNLKGDRGAQGEGADLTPATASSLGGVKIPDTESGLIIDEGGKLRVNMGAGINIDSYNSISLTVPHIVDHTEITYGGAEMSIDVWSLSTTKCRVDFYGTLLQSGGLMANVRIPLSSSIYYAHGNYIAVSGRHADNQTAVIGVTVSDGQITFDKPYMAVAMLSGSIFVQG